MARWAPTKGSSRLSPNTAMLSAPLAYKARGLFSQPICAKEDRSGPLGSNQGLFKAKPKHRHAVCTLGLQGERTVFSANLCKGGKKWPAGLQPRALQG